MRSRKPMKDIQCNGQTNKDKQTNYDLQLKFEQHGIHKKKPEVTQVPRRVNSSCSTTDTHRV